MKDGIKISVVKITSVKKQVNSHPTGGRGVSPEKWYP